MKILLITLILFLSGCYKETRIETRETIIQKETTVIIAPDESLGTLIEDPLI